MCRQTKMRKPIANLYYIRGNLSYRHLGLDRYGVPLGSARDRTSLAANWDRVDKSQRRHYSQSARGSDPIRDVSKTSINVRLTDQGKCHLSNLPR